MVRRQGSRFGVITNQSVRRSNVSANQDVNQYVVIKTMSKAPLSAKENKRVLAEYSQQIQDGNLASNSEISEKDPKPILYSLNKHKRWELPEMIKENILDEENHTESKFQLTLSERHIGASNGDITSRGGDCIAVHQSTSDHPQRLPKRTYAFEADLAGAEKKGKKSRRRKNKSRQIDTEEEEVVAEDVIPEIHYEVCYPKPKNKYQNYGRMSKNTDVTVKSGKKSNTKSHMEWMADEELEDFEEFYDDEAFVAHESVSSRLTHDESDYSPVTLGNVLVTLLIDAVCAEPDQDKPKQRRRHRSKASTSSQEDSDFETKDHIVVIDKEEAERFQPKDEPEERVVQPNRHARRVVQQNRHARKRARRAGRGPEAPPKPEIPPVDPDMKIVKKIYVNSFKSGYLQETFGDCYVEGNCLPRRFVINLKPSVEEHLKNKGHERIAKTLIESSHQMLLLFEPFGCVEAVLGSDEPAFQQVRLKIVGFSQDFLQKIVKINFTSCVCPTSSYAYEAVKMTPPKHCIKHCCVTYIWSVTEIVEFFKTAMVDVPPTSFYRDDGAIGWAAKQPTVALETIKTITQIEWQSATPSAILQNVKIQKEVTIPETNSSTSDAKPTNCSICYDSLLKAVSGVDASALTACGHWFCNECWTQHLRSRVKQGDTNIICPEFDCDTPVDKILLLGYLTTKEYRTQSIHHRNTMLNSQPDWKWCPNNACGRMVKTIAKSGSKVDQDNTVAINCECGLLWCSSCKGEGHWPATCEQAAAYWKLIKKNGSVRWKLFSAVGDIQHVRVKRCPFCRNLIEKHTGCNYMYCICQKAFCWDCLQDYNKHDYSKCRVNKKKLQKVALKESKPMVISMPGVALQHRERRTRLAVVKRRKAAEILAKKAFLIQQGPKEPSRPRLPNIDDTCSIASSVSTSSSILSVTSYKSLPLTWIQDDESSWQLLQNLLETAANAAKFCSEAEFCLEHLEVLINDPNTELRSPATLHQLKDRLIFIADQLHMILHGEIKVNADYAMERVVILMNAGKKCLKWIAANIPFVLAQDDEQEE